MRRAARTWAGQGVRACVRGGAGASGVRGVGPGTGQAGPTAGERRARMCACADAANGSAAIVLVRPAGIGGTRRRLGGGSTALGRRARAHACALRCRGPGVRFGRSEAAAARWVRHARVRGPRGGEGGGARTGSRGEARPRRPVAGRAGQGRRGRKGGREGGGGRKENRKEKEKMEKRKERKRRAGFAALPALGRPRAAPGRASAARGSRETQGARYSVGSDSPGIGRLEQEGFREVRVRVFQGESSSTKNNFSARFILVNFRDVTNLPHLK